MANPKGQSGQKSSRATWQKEQENLVADLTALRAAIVGINAKLDADGGVSGTDFAATWNPAALKTTV